MSNNVAFLPRKIYNIIDDVRNEGAFMREQNRRPRKISDGRKSNNFMKYAKRFIKNVKRAWRRNVKPAIYATIEMLADKISNLRQHSDSSAVNRQSRPEQRAMSKKRRRRKILKIKIASIGIAVILAVTGIAGPGGGTEEKPVGLVYIACCIDGEVWVEEYHFNGDRQKIRDITVKRALDLLRRCLRQSKAD